MINDSDDGGRDGVWEADSDLTATVGVALAEMARAQSRGVPVASHAAMVADALREAQRAVDDVVRRLRVVAGDARRAN